MKSWYVLPMLWLLLVAGCASEPEVVAATRPPPTESPYVWAPWQGVLSPNYAQVEFETEDVILEGATIFTSTGRVFEGSVWLAGGVIKEVSENNINGGPQTVRLDASGKYITAGLVDSHSHLGVSSSPAVPAHSDVNEATGPVGGGLDILHSVWPQDPGFQKAVMGGVTIAQILPGSANIVGGLGVTLQLTPAISARDMVLDEAPRGVKIACGENPKRVYGSRNILPSTRMGNYSVLRSGFQRAVELRDNLRRHEEAVNRWKRDRSRDSRPLPPARDRSLETLIAVMEGLVLPQVHCYRADEMIQMLELANEYQFEIRSFHHAVEAYKIADVLAEHNVSVSIWADWWGFKMESWDAIRYNAGLVHAAGGRTIIHSDSPVGIQRLNQEAAKALYAARQMGLEIEDDEAIQWITINPAWALGIEDLTGTVEKGKRADLVVWSAHPLSVYARAELVFVKGTRQWDAGAGSSPWSDFEVQFEEVRP